MLSSAYNFQMITSFEVLEFDALFSDAHYLYKIQFDIRNLTQKTQTRTHRNESPGIKLWDDSKKESFVLNLDYGEILKTELSLDLMSSGYNLNSTSIDRVVYQIENLFKTTALSSFGRKKKTAKTCRYAKISKKKMVQY